MKTIKVHTIREGQPLQAEEIPNTLESKQSIVNGRLEAYQVSEGIDLWFNEEMRMRNDLNVNIVMVYNDSPIDLIKGNVFFSSYDSEGHSVELSQNQIKTLKSHFRTATDLKGNRFYALEIK